MGAHQASNKKVVTLIQTISDTATSKFFLQVWLKHLYYSFFIKSAACQKKELLRQFLKFTVPEIICIALQKYDRTRYEILYTV